jgi:hypothetical protein
MRVLLAVLTAMASVLSGCIGGAPLSVADDNPASPNAASGPVDVPSVIAGYKSAADFETNAQIKASPGGHVGTEHGAMPDMPGMPHEGAAHGAEEQ